MHHVVATEVHLTVPISGFDDAVAECVYPGAAEQSMHQEVGGCCRSPIRTVAVLSVSSNLQHSFQFSGR